MFEAMTYDAIMARMLDRIPDDMDKREGSVIWDALSPAALELEFLYLSLEYTISQGFADTQEREYLVRRCAERGIAPYPASSAVLRGEFAPADIDVTGQRFSLNKLNYVVLEPIEGEAGAYMVACETAGAAGGQSFGALIPIEYVGGLESAKLTELLIPGEDEEDTEALRKRYFASFSSADYGGNAAGYLRMALGIPGVGAAKATPAWNGAGTVKMTILDGGYNAASDTLVSAVQREIDPAQDGLGAGLAFIGHVVTVESAAQTEVSVLTSVTFESGYTFENMKESITQAVEGYFLELRRAWSNMDAVVVRISQIESRILALEGVVDVAGTAINGAAANLTLDAFAVPVLSEVTGNGA